MDLKYMKEAIKEAKKALKNGDVPVGVVIVKDNRIIARAYNQKEKTKDGTNHAEIIAIKKACKVIKDWRLNGCTLYVNLEPCLMCLGAILQSRIDKVIYGANADKDYIEIINSSLEIEGPVLEEECSKLLKDFFKNRREKA
jgi:tRNA(adenine34) deaminase